MTIRDVQLLVDGFALGAYTMLLIHMIHGLVQDRRDRRVARRQARIYAADQYLRSLRRYQRQQRIEAQ